MRGFIATYRWELWLIVGVPVITLMVRTFAFIPSGLLFDYSANTVLDLATFSGGLVGLLLLSISYLRVRHLGRDFLTILWGYTVVAAVIGTVSWAAVVILGIAFPGASPLTVLGRTFSVFAVATLPHVLALLWFARWATRLSLIHAAFLLVYSSFSVVGSVTGSSVSGSSTYLVLASFLVGGAITLTVMLTKVWLLGNFDRHGPTFRRDAVIGLMVTIILSGYARVVIGDLIGYVEGPYLAILPLLGLLFDVAAFIATTMFELATLLVLFVLIYVTRVRQPAPPQQA